MKYDTTPRFLYCARCNRPQKHLPIEQTVSLGTALHYECSECKEHRHYGGQITRCPFCPSYIREALAYCEER